MSFSMSGASLSVFELGLNTLSALLDKAEAFAAAKKIDPAVLLRTRLAPDMFDFTRQVQTVSDQARRGAARLAGAEPPSVEDTETTIDQLKARLAKTIAYLKTLDPNERMAQVRELGLATVRLAVELGFRVGRALMRIVLA